jgi:glutathione synthase/RimK-type ligase-like ATP-grasp enzyme
MDPSIASGTHPDILLLTGGARMPVPDPESGLLLTALADRGVRAAMVAWDAPVDWARTPLVVLRTPWDYTFVPDAFVARMRAIAAVTTVVNDPELVAWNHHKAYLAELASAGVPGVALALVARGADDETRAAALAAFGEDIVVKPAISAGAFGTIRTRATCAEARDHLAQLLGDGDALVQPYLPEVESGEVSLMYFDSVLSHAVCKRPADGDFRVHAEHGGTVEPHDATPAERAVADAVLRAVPVAPVYARIDIVTTAEGPLLMEAELIEPELFFTADPLAAPRFADVLVSRLRACAREGEHGGRCGGPGDSPPPGSPG